MSILPHSLRVPSISRRTWNSSVKDPAMANTRAPACRSSLAQNSTLLCLRAQIASAAPLLPAPWRRLVQPVRRRSPLLPRQLCLQDWPACHSIRCLLYRERAAMPMNALLPRNARRRPSQPLAAVERGSRAASRRARLRARGTKPAVWPQLKT